MSKVPWGYDSEGEIERPVFGPAHEKEAAGQRVRRISVLLVEDNPDDAHLVQLLASQISGVALDIVWVDRLSEAIHRLAKDAIDLVLLDLGLPECTGLETLRRTQKHAPDTPIVVLSGNDDDLLAIEAVRTGAQDYLVKGMDAHTLGRSIRYALGRQRQRRRTQRALDEARTSERNLRTILEKNLDGIVVVDRQGNVLHANPAAEGLFGFGEGELAGRPCGFPLSCGKTEEIEFDNRSGTVVDAELRVVEIQWAGQPAYLALLRDLTEHKQLELNREKMDMARQVQRALLPMASPDLPGFDIAGISVTADQTGGDYFDFVSMPDGCLGIVVGDASGHGFGPAILIAEVSAGLRALASVTKDVGSVLTRLNRQICSRMLPGQFVTILLVQLNPIRRVCSYASAGHPDALLFDASGRLKNRLPPTGMLAGMDDDVEYATSAEVALQSGDVLVVISDGVIEEYRHAAELFGWERAIEFVGSQIDRPARELAEGLCRAAGAFCAPGPRHDDMTVVVVRAK